VDNLLITRIAVIPGLISYSSGFISRNEEHSLFSTLRDQTIWEQHFVRIFGKQHPCPRLSAWYGIPEATYSYSGQDLTPRPFTPLLNSLLERVKTETDETFNSVLLNLYRDGSDAMGWHADDEPELGIHPVIASLSLGSVRRFLIKPKKSRGTSRATRPRTGISAHHAPTVSGGICPLCTQDKKARRTAYQSDVSTDSSGIAFGVCGTSGSQ